MCEQRKTIQISEPYFLQALALQMADTRKGTTKFKSMINHQATLLSISMQQIQPQ